MQHRGADTQTNPTHTAEAAQDEVAVGTLTELMATQQLVPGKHRAAVVPHIPVQTQPTHDVVEEEPETDPEPESVTRVVPARTPAVAPATFVIPDSARWKASHLPRTIVAITLVMSALGTAVLGAHYARSRTSDDFISLVIGIAVVVVLWALVIASTPQVVTLSGSVLTVHNTSGSERFDLADGLQPVDVVGDPRTSHWAVLLHRPNTSTVVLRHHDVDAFEVDPIVRHYRRVAEQRHAERDARFSR
jgi:hypothetical protein